MADAPKMEVVQVPVDDLVLDDRNAWSGDVGAIVESLREFGQHRACVVQRSSNKVIAGNHMLKAARLLGWDTIGVTYVDDDDKAAIRRAIADNATHKKGDFVDDVLRELIMEVGDAPIAGLDDRDINRLMREVVDNVRPEPVYPIVARLNEQYSYVMVIATSEIDDLWLEDTFHLRTERSYKNQKVAHSRLVTVERLREEWQSRPDQPNESRDLDEDQ